MDAVLGQLLHVAGHKFVILVVVRVELLFVPLQDGLELVDAALHGLDLVVGVAVKAHARGGVGIFGVPHQVGHHALVLAAGNQRVAADLGVGFDNQHGVAVLRRLRGRGDTRAARAHDHHVMGDLDGLLRLVGEGLGARLQRRHVAAGLLGRRVDGVKDRAAGEGGAGHGIHARRGVLDDFGEQDVVGHVADVLRLSGRDDLDGLDGVLGEGDAQHHVAVVAGGGAFIGARRESDFRHFLRLAPCLRQGIAHGGLDGGAGDGGARDAVNAVGIRLAHVRRAHLLDGRAAQRRGFTVAGDFDGGDRLLVHRHRNVYRPAEALRGGFIGSRRKRRCAGGHGCAQQHDYQHNTRPFSDVHSLFPPVMT